MVQKLISAGTGVFFSQDGVKNPGPENPALISPQLPANKKTQALQAKPKSDLHFFRKQLTSPAKKSICPTENHIKKNI